jgi:ABC-type transport system involved in multi-copper enzyme maturation permease subunit
VAGDDESERRQRGQDFYFCWLEVIGLTCALLLPPALLAGSITREREKQTWNALLLSRLTKPQVVFGKFLGGLFPCALLFVTFFPINLLAAFVAGVSWKWFLVQHALIIVTALGSGALGLLCSWMFRRTQIALVATVTGILLLTLGTLLAAMMWQSAAYAQYINVGRSPNIEDFAPLWLNPYFSLNATLENFHYNGSMDSVEKWKIASQAMTALFWGSAFVVGALTTVTLCLRRGPREITH